MVAWVCISASDISCTSERSLVRRVDGNAEGLDVVITTLDEVSNTIVRTLMVFFCIITVVSYPCSACRKHRIRYTLCDQCPSPISCHNPYRRPKTQSLSSCRFTVNCGRAITICVQTPLLPGCGPSEGRVGASEGLSEGLSEASWGARENKHCAGGICARDRIAPKRVVFEKATSSLRQHLQHTSVSPSCTSREGLRTFRMPFNQLSCAR